MIGIYTCIYTGVGALVPLYEESHISTMKSDLLIRYDMDINEDERLFDTN